MVAAFQDTLFAYILRSAFGSRVFPHPDEKALPITWQEKLSSQSTLNVAPHFDATSILSEGTAITNALGRVDLEKDNDKLLVDWYGPTDPDVSCRFMMRVPHSLILVL